MGREGIHLDMQMIAYRAVQYRTAREPEQRVAHIPPIDAPGPGTYLHIPQKDAQLD